MLYHDYSKADKKDRVVLTRSDLVETSAKNFRTPDEFIPESFSLSVRGLLRTKGAAFDYTITGPNTFLVLCDLSPSDNMVVEYTLD